MRTTADFLQFYRRQRGWTARLVAAVPEEHFDWRPAEGAFSCGDLVRHLVQAEVFWTRLLTKAAAGEDYDPFEIPGDADERMSAFRRPNAASAADEASGASFAETMEKWEAVQARSEEALAAIPDEALHGPSASHPLTRFEGQVWELMLLSLTHEAHHRGQLSAYLKVLGVEQDAAAFGS